MIEPILNSRCNEFSIARVGMLGLGVCRLWNDAAWREFCEMVSQISAKSPCDGVVLLSCYAVPTSAQRKTLFEQYRLRMKLDGVKRFAFLSDSFALRSSVTVFSWVLPKVRIRTYRPHSYLEAFRWTREIAEFNVPTAVQTFNAMLARSGYPASLLGPALLPTHVF